MARQGLHTGILDTDIYGPSIPTLLNVRKASAQQQEFVTNIAPA
jgi:Mrp family chromosome partitioning ATPase